VPTGFTSREKCGILAAVLVSLEAVLAFTVPHSYRLTAFGDVTQCLLLLFVLLAMLGNVRAVEARSRLFWALMGLGCGIWLCVQILWTYFEVFLRTDVPNPFVGDVALFLHLVPLMGALAVRPDLERDESVVQPGGLDLLLLVTWWLYLYLFVVIPWQYVWPHKELYGRSFDLLYFLEHFVFVCCAGTVWLRSTGPWKTIYGNLFGAALLYAFSSVTASVAIDLGRYYTGSVYDTPLVISFLWFAAVGLVGRRFASRRTRVLKATGGTRGVWVSGLAMVAILSLPVLAGWSLYMSHAPTKVQNFRLLLTLATMMLMGALLWIKQHGLDREIGRSNQKLREDSYTDLLTGSKNRRYLTATIEADARRVVQGYSAETNSFGKRNPDLVFYLIDCDYFKEVNDQYGHETGDQLLVEIARQISSAIRHSDVLIRWGGDEFLVVSRYTNREEASILAERVLQAVGSEPSPLKGGNRLRCTCSIGWAVFPWFVREPEAVDYTDVLRLADCALYDAKKAGKNQAIGMLPTREQSLPFEGMTVGKDARLTEQLAARTLTTLGPQPGPADSAEKLVTAKGVAAAQV
jgi:diguanylate cyclase (GGDEF)-like protein